MNWKFLIITFFTAALLSSAVSYSIFFHKGEWYYPPLQLLSIVLFYGSIAGSLIHTILLILKFRNELRPRLGWLLLSGAPIAYFILSLLMAFIAGDELVARF